MITYARHLGRALEAARGPGFDSNLGGLAWGNRAATGNDGHTQPRSEDLLSDNCGTFFCVASSSMATAPSGATSSSPRGDAPLPSGWTREMSKKQNRVYYFHAATNTSKWNLEDVVGPAQRDAQEESVVDQQPHATKRPKPAQPKLAVIVPYRDDAAHVRAAQLAKFIPHMNGFLSKEAGLAEFKLFIVEQDDDKRKFNRGKLLNIGFLLATKEGFDSFVFHDVDLLPQPPLASYYAARPVNPIHIAKCWSRYNGNPAYLGGIVSFSKEHFETIRGFPNVYWGWGGEDDELKKRVDFAKLRVEAPPSSLPDAIVDLENKTLDEKLSELKSKRDEKCNVKWEVNAAHDELRSTEPKPKWWGLPVDFRLVKRFDSAAEHYCIATVDVGLNYEEDGRGHWTNDKLI